MATFTDNFALVKPTYGELADVAVINGNMDTVDGIMHSNRTMLAPAFSQTEDYAVGDIVVYEGNLYRFIVPHTAGNWDGTEVEQTTLGEEVSTKGGADVTKTASGNPITFTDGADAPLVKCVTEIQGSQDLHGYDKPWVGGSGKNKLPLPAEQTINGVTLTHLPDGGIKLTGTPTGNAYFDCFAGTFDSTAYAGYRFKASYIGSSSGISFRISESNRVTMQDLYNNNVINDMGDNLYFALRVAYNATIPSSGLIIYPMLLSPSETNYDFAPYSNICPITAYTEGEIEVRGKNLLVNDFEQGAINSGAGYTYDTLKVSNSTRIRIANLISLDPNSTYTISCDFSKYRIVAQPFDEGGISINPSSPFNEWKDSAFSFTGTHKVAIAIKKTSETDITPSEYEDAKPQIELGTTATAYEPYAGHTYTISLGDTYYSGQIDVVRGVLVATSGIVILNTSAMDNGASYPGWRNQTWVRDVVGSGYNDKTYSIKLNVAEYCYVSTVGTANTVFFNPADDGMTLSKWVDTGLDVQFVYPLATSIEIPLTPTVISSLLGTNTMWTDGDNLEVEYITEEFQPLVDLIESNKHVYSTAEQIVGTWIDGSTLYEKSYHVPTLTNTYIIIDSTISASTIKLRSVSMGSIVIGGAYNNAQYVGGHLSYSSFIRVILNVGLSVGMEDPPADPITDFDFTIRYTKSTTPTRSLNLTKSAVTEIPEEIKNAPFEEKPDYNEADDSAPTEVDER